MQETTYSCDRCRNVVGKNDLDSVSVRMTAYVKEYSRHKLELCRSCMHALGLIAPPVVAKAEPPPAPDVFVVLGELVALMKERGLFESIFEI